jgi:uncharacterized protein DUF3800
MTLAAFAGSDAIWAEFDGVWQGILAGYTPPAPYIHMREIINLEKGFSSNLGWTHEIAFHLITQCLQYLQHIDKSRFVMFYCAIDLDARRRLIAETYQIPDPIELCNRFCSETVLGWYLIQYPGLIDAADFFFDADEAFKEPFERKWNGELRKAKESGEPSRWSVVRHISSVNMRKVPGIQAADMLAWAVNKEHKKYSGPGTYMAHIMRQVIPARSIVWDEARMRKEFAPLLYLP